MVRITTKCLCGYCTIREVRNNEEDSEKKIISGDKNFINIAPLTVFVPMYDFQKRVSLIVCPNCGAVYAKDIAVKEEEIR